MNHMTKDPTEFLDAQVFVTRENASCVLHVTLDGVVAQPVLTLSYANSTYGTQYQLTPDQILAVSVAAAGALAHILRQ